MKRNLVGRLFSVFMILLAAAVVNTVNPLAEEVQSTGSYTLYDINLNVKQPVFLYGLNVNNHIVIEEKVKKNEFLSDILSAYNVPVKLINELAAIPRTVFDVRKIAANKKYTMITR